MQIKTRGQFLAKTLVFFLAIPLFAKDGMIEKRTDQTLFTCQQQDGDIWIEAGISKISDEDYMLTVVENNVDTDSKTLLLRKKVTYGIDSQQTLKGTDFTELVLNIYHPYEQGELRFKRSADSALEIHPNLKCYEKSEISWNQASFREPRFSVGN